MKKLIAGIVAVMLSAMCVTGLVGCSSEDFTTDFVGDWQMSSIKVNNNSNADVTDADIFEALQNSGYDYTVSFKKNEDTLTGTLTLAGTTSDFTWTAEEKGVATITAPDAAEGADGISATLNDDGTLKMETTNLELTFTKGAAAQDDTTSQDAGTAE